MNSQTIVLFLILLVFTISCNSEKSPPKNNSSGLEEMAETLNKAIPSFNELYDSKGFYIEKGVPKNFFVYNLIDTTNNSYPLRNPIELGENGIYHFAPVRYRYSFSHIMVIKEGETKTFKNLNCKTGEDEINDVIEFVENNFDYDESIINRIKNYRDFGMYFQTDPQSVVECE